MTCGVCALPLDDLHRECLLVEALAAVAELLAVVVAPAVIVWAG